MSPTKMPFFVGDIFPSDLAAPCRHCQQSTAASDGTGLADLAAPILNRCHQCQQSTDSSDTRTNHNGHP